MTEILQGTSRALVAQFYEYAGGPAQNITSAQITITNLATSTVVVGPTSVGVTNPATGVYVYTWNVGSAQAVGSYLVSWTGTSDGDAVGASEVVLVTSSSLTDAFSSGPCQLWTPTWTCDIGLLSPAVTGAALRAATEVLNAKTAFQFDNCQLTLRPCRRECASSDGYWEWGTTPRPYMWNGVWYNAACGTCGDNCSCVALQEVVLPRPVNQIIEVKVDGVPLVTTAYRVDDWSRLVRLDGNLWPYCNDLTQADTEVGTWSVTATFGAALPELGSMAVGELAAEFARALACDDDCRLPPHVQAITRQGIDIQMLDPNALFAEGRIGLYFSDMFISSFNPHGLVERARVYNLDRPPQRIVGT